MIWLLALRARHMAISGNMMPGDGLPIRTPTGRANAPASADSIISVPGLETLPESQRITVLKKAEYEALTNSNNIRPSG